MMATMSEPLLVGSRVPGETATSGALSFSVIKEMSVLLLERTAMLELLLFEMTGVFESVWVGGCGIFLEPFLLKNQRSNLCRPHGVILLKH